MKIRVWLVSGIVFGALGMAFASVPAQAKNKTVKECTAEWKAAEAAKTTGGKKRADFIAACRQEVGAAPAAAAPAEPAPAPKPMAPKPMATAPKPMEKPDHYRQKDWIARQGGLSGALTWLLRRVESRQSQWDATRRSEVAAVLA